MKKYDLKNWANLAEIVSSLAVLATLVFVVIEIRSNSNLIRANAFDRNIESLIDWRMQVVSDEQSLEYMADYWSVENPETLKQSLLVLSLWSVYEKTYFAHQYDLVGPSEWQRFQYVICDNLERSPDFWEAQVGRLLTPEFREYIDTTCN